MGVLVRTKETDTALGIIAEQRAARGLTYADIAKPMGLSRARVNSWFNGAQTIPADRVADLAAILKCEADVFTPLVTSPDAVRGKYPRQPVVLDDNDESTEDEGALGKSSLNARLTRLERAVARIERQRNDGDTAKRVSALERDIRKVWSFIR